MHELISSQERETGAAVWEITAGVLLQGAPSLGGAPVWAPQHDHMFTAPDAKLQLTRRSFPPGAPGELAELTGVQVWLLETVSKTPQNLHFLTFIAHARRLHQDEAQPNFKMAHAGR